jgi:phospholipid transport system substrate-binding protein
MRSRAPRPATIGPSAGRLTRAALLALPALLAAPAKPAQATAEDARAAHLSDPPARGGRPPSPGADGCDPLTTLRRSDAEIRATVARRFPDWSPEASVRQARLDRQLRALLDYEEISRRALDSTWASLSEADRRSFVSTFAALASRTFLDRMTGRRLRVSYDDQVIAGAAASVTVTASSADPGRAAPQHLEYHLTRKGQQWMVIDVVIDGASMLDSYQRQFRTLVKKEGFAGLMARMQQKLADRRPE